LDCCEIMELSPPFDAFNCANLSFASKKLLCALVDVFSALSAVYVAFSLATLVADTVFSAATILALAASKPILAVPTAFFAAGMGGSATTAAALTTGAFLAGAAGVLTELAGVDVLLLVLVVVFTSVDNGVDVLTAGIPAAEGATAATISGDANSVETAKREAATKLVTTFLLFLSNAKGAADTDDTGVSVILMLPLAAASASASSLFESRDWRRTAVVEVEATKAVVWAALLLLFIDGAKASLVLSSATTATSSRGTTETLAFFILITIVNVVKSE
jgi:hypothetical protein